MYARNSSEENELCIPSRERKEKQQIKVYARIKINHKRNEWNDNERKRETVERQ